MIASAKERRQEPTPHPPPVGSLARRLRSLGLPQIAALDARLKGARHGTLVDDRLHQSVPILRFRIQPWRGPFDEPGAVPGSVLEFAVEETPRQVVARYWLDPLATAPAHQQRIDGEDLARPWVERVLVDFVDKALHRA